MFVKDVDILLSEVSNTETMVGIIPRPLDAVWKVLADFDSTPRWIAAIVESTTSRVGNGDIRTLKLKTGGTVREKLEAIDERDRTLRFQILESPLPLAGYRSTMALRELGEKQCLLIWTSIYPEGTPESAKAAAKSIHEMGYAGLRAIA